MASAASPFLLTLLLFFLSVANWTPLACRGDAAAPAFGLDFHHRFSDRVRSWAESASWDVGHWPEKGTADYYTTLIAHDREMLRGRGLLGESDLTFAGGNITYMISSLGFLHYAEVALGTPNMTFLVALDTGSDLFWVPCDCKNCTLTLENQKFNIFNSSLSSTSKKVPCSSNLCERQHSCFTASEVCPYEVKYVDNTSSSGVILKDVLHLITDDTSQEPVQATVPFGCAQVQTGSPILNGLLGLGLENISVPSTLVAAGLTANSFSMCFGHNGVGRIRFGDKGSSDLETTPLNLNRLQYPRYNISITGIVVGNRSLNADFTAIFDSGASFTFLADPAYTDLAESFNSLALHERIFVDSEVPFDYCYSISPDETSRRVPNISLIMKGEKEFPVISPLEFLSGSVEGTRAYCLAVVKSSSLNVIGQNFMSGLKIVFDRENLVLGWKEFDCYDIENKRLSPATPPNSSAPNPSTTTPPPSVISTPPPSSMSMGPRSPAEATPQVPNMGNSLAVSLYLGRLFHFNCMLWHFLLLLFLIN